MRPFRLLSILCGVPLMTACQNPRVQANMAEAINEIGTEVSSIRQDLSDLQVTVDSLRQVAAHQDSIIVRLANVAGVQIPR